MAVRSNPLDLVVVWAARGVAQLGSARRSGRRGRRFKSSHPDDVNLTSETSGGLATRIRAYGLVPIPAET